MLTVEYRVNGQLIGVTNVRNTLQTAASSKLEFVYLYDHRMLDSDEVRKGSVLHCRSDGADKLVMKVLADAAGE